jgi:hypothetical protein
MLTKQLFITLLFIFNLSILTACQLPCKQPVHDGYTRFIPTESEFELGFDYPSDWRMNPDRSLEKLDSSGQGKSILVKFSAATVEKYPHIVDQGKIIVGGHWGKPFPGRALEIKSRTLVIDGYQALNLAYDFETPITLMDGTSPVTSWGFMQFTFIVVNDHVYDIRFYASDEGKEKQLQKEYEKLVRSICIFSEGPAQ